MKVSIVTITHNRGHLVGKTIQSVLDQTHENFEHIIIDDGSTDNTEDIVNSFNDSRILYFKYPKNPLRSFMRNEGFRKASGELISVLDSDDLWTNDKLEIIVSTFNNNPDIDFVIHNIVFIKDGEKSEAMFKKKSSGIQKKLLDELLNDEQLPYPVFTIRKLALKNIGLLDENLTDGQHDLYLRAASKLKTYYISDVLTYMTKHDQNISRDYLMSNHDHYFTSLSKLLENGAISKAK